MDNTRDLGGKELIVNTDEEEAYFSGRMGVVVAVPKWYEGEIEEGDILLCHHNVFRKYKDWKGRHRDGRAFIRDGLFHVSDDKFFAYKKKGSDEWKPWSKYCLIEPLAPEANDNSMQGVSVYEVPLHGIVHTPNEAMIEQGITKGKKIVFFPDSEYPFNVDGKKLYRMFDEHIAVIYE